ncbi:hypothetical protein [Sphingomonas sanxanigenens]|uniref:hypothetical protein n=1 Tax=Sphingomonas sanxanigenens TaxID=397260 RepID=UPI0005871C97|nr:hypothetical protein [Sphingomonas sanxanigenens]
MSRAINQNARQGHVIAACAKRKIGIGAIETLQSGGTRVVMNNAENIAEIAKPMDRRYSRAILSGLPRAWHGRKLYWR